MKPSDSQFVFNVFCFFWILKPCPHQKQHVFPNKKKTQAMDRCIWAQGIGFQPHQNPQTRVLHIFRQITFQCCSIFQCFICLSPPPQKKKRNVWLDSSQPGVGVLHPWHPWLLATDHAYFILNQVITSLGILTSLYTCDSIFSQLKWWKSYTEISDFSCDMGIR